MWIILDINYNHFYHTDKSQVLAGGCCYFSPSKLHSGTLWSLKHYRIVEYIKHINICCVPLSRKSCMTHDTGWQIDRWPEPGTRVTVTDHSVKLPLSTSSVAGQHFHYNHHHQMDGVMFTVWPWPLFICTAKWKCFHKCLCLSTLQNTKYLPARD